ncbi:MAG: transcription termination factor Rho [Verrucomicrobiota bacterium]
MKKTKTESKTPMEIPVEPAAAPAAAAPRKRAVKKAAAKPESSSAEAETAPAPAAVTTVTVVPFTPRAVLPVPVFLDGENTAETVEKAPGAGKAPAKKAAAKKAARKVAEPVPEPPALVPQAETAAEVIKPKAAKKAPAAKKAVRSSKNADTAEEAPETAAMPVAAVEIPAPAPIPVMVPETTAGTIPVPAVPRKAGKSTRTSRNQAPAVPQEPAPETVSGPVSRNEPAPGPPDNRSGGKNDGSAPPGENAESRDNPDRDRDDGSRPGRGDRDFDSRGPNASGPPGPDGEGRRLTKFERWKLRKEKFKLQKQQRYLERTGRAPQGPGAPGANGQGAQGGVEAPPAQDRREQRDPRDARDQRDPRETRDPREARVWEPRPPRPEPVLGPPEECEGLLELTDNKGFGFLRPRDKGYVASAQDPFVSAELVRQLGLRDGVYIDAVMRRGGRGPMVQEITKVNGLEPNAYRTLPLFEELTAVNPNKRYILETEASRNTTRLIDFISPIGRGQRGLIVAPPRAGKTTFLQHIAEAMLQKYVDVKVIVLLVDERPEEVTELSRALPGAEIMASSNDQDPRNHIRMAHLAIERAKRLVEAGQHVFMLLDSITRLARGFNNAMRGGGGGKAMSGGLDSRALEAPRRLFAAARNTREAGSLTIMATALVETNNKGDDLIFQEFKGTGNMELVLDRKISQQYVYPAVDIFKSGTRREELLLPAHQLEKVHLIRRGLSGHRPGEAVERLLQVMSKYPNNNQMLLEIKSRE